MIWSMSSGGKEGLGSGAEGMREGIGGVAIGDL